MFLDMYYIEKNVKIYNNFFKNIIFCMYMVKWNTLSCWFIFMIIKSADSAIITFGWPSPLVVSWKGLSTY